MQISQIVVTLSCMANYDIIDIRVAVDSDNLDEVRLLHVLTTRAAYLEARQEYEQACNTHTPSSAPLREPEETLGEYAVRMDQEQKRKKKPALPSGKNLEGLRLVLQHGMDYNRLTETLYGDGERENKNKLYARKRTWKSKGWIIAGPDGAWTVSPEVKEIIKKQDE